MVVFLLIASIVLMAASLSMSYYSDRKYRRAGLSKFIDILMSVSIIAPATLIMSGLSDSDIAGGIAATVALFAASAFRSYRYTLSDKLDLAVDGSKSIVLDAVLIVAATLIADIALEFPSNIAVWNMKPVPFLIDMIIALGLVAVPFLVSSGRTLASKIMCVVLFAIGIAEYTVLQFKNLPIQPGDLFALGTAAAVGANTTSGYTLTVGTGCMYGIAALIASLILISLTSRDRKRIVEANGEQAACSIWVADGENADDLAKRAIGYRIVGWVLFALFIGQFTIPYANGLGISVYTWKPIPSYQDNGFLSSFVSTAQLMIPQKPKGYSKKTADKAVKELASRYDEENGEGSAAKAASDQYSQQKPNIVVVMNETFSDLSIYDSIKDAGYDGPQYLKSLYPDSILHGTLQVSAMGGGTCNSEFETLTGNSMAFIGSGVYPYETYNMNIDNLVSQLKGQGYDTHAIHPAAGSNWNRDGVYSAFGFDTFDDEATFTGATRFRNRIDDASTYSKTLEYLNGSDTPQFIFDVTLMGHSGYETGLVPEDKRVNCTVDGLDEKNQNKLNEYLATSNEEDAQLKTLIDGIKKSKKPTIVLFFGDHQPALSEAIGGESDDIVQTEMQWQTCYTMWANYDVAGSVKGTELDTSTSYLSALLCHEAGIPMTDRQKAAYLLMEDVPKINVVGAYLAKNSKHDGEWENVDAAVVNSESMKTLSYLQYRNLFDTGQSIFSTDAKQANDV